MPPPPQVPIRSPAKRSLSNDNLGALLSPPNAGTANGSDSAVGALTEGALQAHTQAHGDLEPREANCGDSQTDAKADATQCGDQVDGVPQRVDVDALQMRIQVLLLLTRGG